MNIPLKIDTFVTKEGDQYIKIWNNSKYEIMKSPILPYIYSKDNPIPFTNSTIIKNMTLLYDGDYPTIYKNEFRNDKEIYECPHDISYMETRIKTLERLYSDKPDFINDYANINELKILYVDIETDTYMTFPTAEENAIIAIGVAMDNNPVELFVSETYNDDKDILNQFFDYIKKYDPDVLVTFNGQYFDIPYICTRCKVNGISTAGFGRGQREVFNTDKKTYIEGRIHYDIYKRSVSLDQNLFKFSTDRKMKTVAHHYNLPDIVEEDESILSNMRSIVNTQQLRDYLSSDIRITRGLSNIYLPAIINLAEMVNISLESCIDGSPSYVPNITYAREYKNQGIISDKTVISAHPELANKQGAIVGCYKPGLFLKNLRKFDVKSMYPNIIRTLNLDPCTTKIIKVTSDNNPYSAIMKNKILTISFHDDNLDKQITIEIDFNARGFSSTLVDTLMTERAEIKSNMKLLDKTSPEWASSDVNQLNRKIIANSITGLFGMSYAPFGSLASYMVITATGRFLITEIMNQLESVIAVDTDGAVFESDENLNDINQWLENFILDFYNIDINYIELEEEKLEAGFFRDASKQYLLLEDGKLITHGASFKGSNLPKLFRSIISNIGLRMLKNDTNLESEIDKYYDTSQFDLNNIKKNIKVRPIDSYKSRNPIGKQLGMQYKARFGEQIEYETQLSYVKIKNKRGSSYQLVTIFDTMDDIERLDIDYYIEIVNSAIDRLGLTHLRPDRRGQKTLFDF